MKCIGSDEPPCARCAKAGRECIVQRPARPGHSFGTSTPGFHVGANKPQNDTRLVEQASGSASGGSNNRDELLGARPTHGFLPINSTPSTTNQSFLPSIYTNPPYSTVLNQSDGTPNQAVENVDSPKRWKRKGQDLLTNHHGLSRQQNLVLTPFQRGILFNISICKSRSTSRGTHSNWIVFENVYSVSFQ